jgi:hypothetical protein
MMPAISSREPSLRSVAIEQLKLIDLNKRLPLLFAILALPAASWPEMVVVPVPPLLLATMAWPLLVWQGQGPSQRNYHRALPVDHVAHDLLKVAAGGIWLFAGIGLTVAFLTFLAAIMPAGIAEAPSPALTPAMLLNVFTGTLIVYLLVSAIPILTDRPLEWLLGICVMIAGAGMLRAVYDDNLISYLVGVLAKGQFGLGQALVGGYITHSRELRLVFGLQGENSMLSWSITTILWLALAFWLVCWASRRANRREAS